MDKKTTKKKPSTRGRAVPKPSQVAATPENLRAYLEAEYLRLFGEAWHDDFADGYRRYGNPGRSGRPEPMPEPEPAPERRSAIARVTRGPLSAESREAEAHEREFEEIEREARKARAERADAIQAWDALHEAESQSEADFARDRTSLNAALDNLRRDALALRKFRDELCARWMPRCEDPDSHDFDDAASLGLDKLCELVDGLPEWFLDHEPPRWRVKPFTKRKSLVQSMPGAWKKPRRIAIVSLLCGNRPDGYGPHWTVGRTADVEADNVRKAVGRFLAEGETPHREYTAADVPDDPDGA